MAVFTAAYEGATPTGKVAVVTCAADCSDTMQNAIARKAGRKCWRIDIGNSWGRSKPACAAIVITEGSRGRNPNLHAEMGKEISGKDAYLFVSILLWQRRLSNQAPSRARESRLRDRIFYPIEFPAG